jgi:O-antigen ligase
VYDTLAAGRPLPAVARSAPPGRAAASHWTPLLLALSGVMLQYVWRVQEVFSPLRLIQFTALVSIASVVLFVTSRGPMRRLRNLKHDLFRLVLCIFALAILSVPTSLRLGDSVLFLTGNFGKTVLQVGILVVSVRDRRDLDRLLRVFAIGGAAYVCGSILFAQPGAGRLGGGSYDPNDLGLFTVSTIPVCIYLMRRNAPVFDRLLGISALALLLTATVLSGSRGGFLALLAVTAYALLFLSSVRASKRWTLTVVAAGAMAITAGDGYWSRIRTVLSPQEDYNWEGKAEGGRIEVWKRGIGYMAQRPLFGVGVDQFGVAEGTLSPLAVRQQYGRGVRWSAAHNSYVQIGAECGVVGVALFIMLLIAAVRLARRIGRMAASRDDRFLGQCFAAMFVGYIVGCTFLSQAYSTYLYFAIGMLIALSQLSGIQLGRTKRAAVRPHGRLTNEWAPRQSGIAGSSMIG